jgi:hypothetical protein
MDLGEQPSGDSAGETPAIATQTCPPPHSPHPQPLQGLSALNYTKAPASFGRCPLGQSRSSPRSQPGHTPPFRKRPLESALLQLPQQKCHAAAICKVTHSEMELGRSEVSPRIR